MSLRSSLMRGSIFDELAAMQREMNRIVRAAEQGAPLPFKAFSEVYPPINISETAEGYELECELPGYSMDDIELTVQGDTMTIKGKKEAVQPEGSSIHRQERRYGSFSRSLTLPAAVDVENVSAKLVSGLLLVNLPKSAAAKPHKIAINA